MNKPESRFRVVCLFVLMLGVVGLSANNAQAEIGANWSVKGVKVTSGLLPALATKEVETGSLILLTKILTQAVAISCTTVQPISLKLETEGKVSSGGQLRFSGCTTKLNEKSSISCEPNNEAKEPGSILTKPGKGLLVSNEGKGIIRVEAKEGETLATIETSEECAVGAKIPIIGKLTLKDSSLASEITSHLFVEGPSTELWALSKTAEHKATLDGSAVIRLAGIHAESNWSGTVEEVAPPGPGWMVKGANINATLKPNPQGAIENETASLLTTILGISVKVLCKAMTITNTLGVKGSINEGRIKFANCATFLKGSETASAPCLPKTSGVLDIIETNTFVGSPTLVGGVGEVVVEAKEAGKPLAVIQSGEECGIGSNLNVTGSAVLKDGEGKIGVELVTHLTLADNAVGTLKVSGQPASLDGSANISLTGVHAGLAWSDLPE